MLSSLMPKSRIGGSKQILTLKILEKGKGLKTRALKKAFKKKGLKKRAFKKRFLRRFFCTLFDPSFLANSWVWQKTVMTIGSGVKNYVEIRIRKLKSSTDDPKTTKTLRP